MRQGTPDTPVPPLPAAQAHLSVDQADDPLAPIQVLAAVACQGQGARPPPWSTYHGDILPLSHQYQG